MIQRHASRNQVSPSRSRRNGNLLFLLECLNGFYLDQSDLAAWAGMLGPIPGGYAVKIAVALQAATRDCFHMLQLLNGRSGLGGYVNRKQRSAEHPVSVIFPVLSVTWLPTSHSISCIPQRLLLRYSRRTFSSQANVQA